jgi:hypothetical protein
MREKCATSSRSETHVQDDQFFSQLVWQACKWIIGMPPESVKQGLDFGLWALGFEKKSSPPTLVGWSLNFRLAPVNFQNLRTPPTLVGWSFKFGRAIQVNSN